MLNIQINNTKNEKSKDNIKEKNERSTKKSLKLTEEKNEEKEIYLIIVYQRNKKQEPNDFIFLEENDMIPEIILNKEIYTNNNKYVYKNVIKIKKAFNCNNCKKKERKEGIIFYITEKDQYIISFQFKGNTFIYDVYLKKGIKYLDRLPKENIDQKLLDYQDKLDLFLDALKLNKEENKIQELYKETIELFSIKKNFYLLIALFTKIYKEKNLCSRLIRNFYEMNFSNKNKYEVTDKFEKIMQFKELMLKISSESETLIKNNDYNPIHFYGVIFCYLNNYDYSSFEKYINVLSIDKSEILYEILLTYFNFLLKPIIKDENDKEFFFKFFEYIISKKDFSNFMLGLTFISDLDTFIAVVNYTKEQIIYYEYIKENSNKEKFKPLKIEDNLKLKKDRINDIIKGIESINAFSDYKNVILVYFKSDFWKKLLKEYNIPSPDYIVICWKLRELFIDYDKIINKICNKEKEKDIINDIKVYREHDEFAYLLNENIKAFLKEKKGNLKNFEIIGYIMNYNPYYIEEQYKNKREFYILDYLNFEYDYNNNNEHIIEDHHNFIETFRMFGFENVFKDNIYEFLNRIVNKITDISSFDTVIDLILLDRIKEKVKGFIESLKNKYELFIKHELEKLEKNNIDKPVEIIVKFAKLIFEQECNCNFLEQQIDKLEICPLIYNQLIRTCKDEKFNVMRDFILNKFINKNYSKNINYIIELIDSLDQKYKEEFLKELMIKCRFSKKEFYSTEENSKINLLFELYKKVEIERIYEYIKITLDDIFNDIEREEIEKNN